MMVSLRGRLLIGVITLIVIVLLVSDAFTYVALQRSLVNSIDLQLTGGRVDATTALGGPDRGSGNQQSRFPVGTVVELVGPDGNVEAVRVTTSFGVSPSEARPAIPSLHPTAADTPTQPVTVPGTDEVPQFRLTYWSEDSFNGEYVVLAIPLTDVNHTLSQLLLVEGVIAVVVVGGTALLAWLIIQVGLRPLQRMGAVAEDIAAGDLSRRVEPATPRTEIGRLGLALNAMLSQIEAAFAERKASENRLRRFIADASHELRTPLTSIRGYSEMLRRGADESPHDSALARRRIEEESVRMSTLVDDMLLIARLDQGRPLETKPVDLQVIAHDAAADARAVAPQREITLHGNGPLVVTGDDTRLRQVLGNLMRNAIVHTPSGSPIEINLAGEQGLAHVSVVDHGPGLPAEARERIFEPFYRADPSRSRDSGGAGLGLSIVTAVVTAHHGRVRVMDTAGGGTTFEVELPLAASGAG